MHAPACRRLFSLSLEHPDAANLLAEHTYVYILLNSRELFTAAGNKDPKAYQRIRTHSRTDVRACALDLIRQWKRCWGGGCVLMAVMACEKYVVRM